LSAALGAGAVLPAQAVRTPTLAALSAVEKGPWELHEVGDRRAPRLCLPEVSEVLQLRHRGGAGCSRFVIANEPRTATVHYTCPGAGHGRTTLTVETPRVMRVETQGIASNAPFDQRFEARRVASCGAR
jgi:hypothetical protein